MLDASGAVYPALFTKNFAPIFTELADLLREDLSYVHTKA